MCSVQFEPLFVFLGLPNGVFYANKTRNAFRILVGKHQLNRLLGRRSSRCEDTIKMHLSEVRCENVN
jgi:hypothetical protein